MKTQIRLNIFFAFLSVMLLSSSAQAQIEKLIVEKYYISDVNDASDTTKGNHLPVGSTTYRVFLDLAKGNKLISIYGDQHHTFRISSDSVFFNNHDYPVTNPKIFNIANYKHNTVALDTWLALGQVSGKNGSTAYFGVPKADDKNGSIIGGSHNDGGSAGITSGLLTNSDSLAGIPLTKADGMDTMSTIPGNWNEYLSPGSIDSTIFGSIISDTVFKSNNFFLNNSGVSGVDPDSNQVLIAQLTTKGKLTFELNVLLLDSVGGDTLRLVANDSVTLNGEVISPYLVYPQVCGCLDPNYLEFSNRYACSEPSQCKTIAVLGCMDPLACNYDPTANINVSLLCCYPGYCNDRDLASVCPDLFGSPQVFMFPNPAKELIILKIEAVDNEQVSYTVTDSQGKTVLANKDLGTVAETVTESIVISSFKSGVYYCNIKIGNSSETRAFTKQ